MVSEFSFNDHAKPAQIKQDIGPMLTVNVDSLGIRSDPEPRYENGKLRVYHFLAVSLFRHAMVSLGIGSSLVNVG